MKREKNQHSINFRQPIKFILENKKNGFVAVLVSVWLLGTLFAFWWFQFRNIQVFDLNAEKNQTVFFESGELGERLENLIQKERNGNKQEEIISVVHFWNPDCPCNRFNEKHVNKIISDFADKNVQFTIVVSGKNSEVRKRRSTLARQIFKHKAVKNIRNDWPMDNGPPSSPAAGILNSSGELVYFGPYSLGARCAPDKGSFVEKVLENLESKKRNVKKQLNTLAVGCFCPWRSIV